MLYLATKQLRNGFIMNIIQGLLADTDIELFIKNGVVTCDAEVENTQIQPASLDLRLGKTAYRVRASFLSGPTEAVEKKLKQLQIHEIDLTQGAVFETNCIYVVPLLESLELPAGVSAVANPKSSIGRLDIFTRVISDFSECFNNIAAGYAGPLYLEVCPRTFPIIVRMGSKLTQMRFCKSAALEQKLKSTYDPTILRVDLSNKLLGYRAKRHTKAIDIDKVASYDSQEFWDPLYNSASQPNELVLEPDQFYILASYENVVIASNLAAEMVPFDPLIGEFRVHYAGFFDPGFGLGQAQQSKAVLEIRSHEVPFMLAHKQIIGKLLFSPMLNTPHRLYGTTASSNYQGQQLKLAKQFY